MSSFCPDGYLPMWEAIRKAAKYWFPDKFPALETATPPDPSAKAGNDFDAVVRAFSQPLVPDAWRHAFEQTAHRLRSFLHQGTLKAYYFGKDRPHFVSRQFWATPQAHGVVESGDYWPFGRPKHWHDQGLCHPLFVKQSELDAVLNEQPAERPRLPRAKIPDLATALGMLDHLPNRKKQREAVRKLPEFERYRLTDDVFREAEKKAPRKAGRKPLRPEQ